MKAKRENRLFISGVFISKELSRVEREKNMKRELKELRENETEREWYKIKKMGNS